MKIKSIKSITTKLNTQNNKKTMQNTNNNFLTNLISELEKGESSALLAIKKALHSEELQLVIENVFQKNNYIIRYARPKNQDELATNLQEIDNLGLDIIPKLQKIIKNQDGSMFIISKIKPNKNNQLKMLWNEPYQNIPQNNLLKAYEDFKKLSAAGFKSDGLFEYDDCWQLTNNNEIILPALYDVSKCLPFEKDILNSQYYKILFK